MASYGFSDHFEAFSSGGFVVDGGLRGGLSAAAAAASLVLDSKKGELVKAPARVGKKGISETKALVALKNHSEAERRRRERINAHLSTLRGLVPCNEKVITAYIIYIYIYVYLYMLFVICFWSVMFILFLVVCFSEKEKLLCLSRPL